MKRYAKKLIIFGMITLPLYAVFIVCMFTGTIAFSYYGFAVDSSGLLYVGKNSKMDVYSNGEFLKTVYKTTRGYRFTIQDENLYIATEGQVKIMDLSGNLIHTIDDSDWSEEHRLDKEKFLFVTDDARYVATNVFGFYKITKFSNEGGSEIIYQKPIIGFILGLVAPIGVVSYIIVLLTLRLYIFVKDTTGDWKSIFLYMKG